MFSGSLKFNLDPSGERSETELRDAADKVGFHEDLDYQEKHCLNEARRF